MGEGRGVGGGGKGSVAIGGALCGAGGVVPAKFARAHPGQIDDWLGRSVRDVERLLVAHAQRCGQDQGKTDEWAAWWGGSGRRRGDAMFSGETEGDFGVNSPESEEW